MRDAISPNRWVCSLGKAMHREQKLVLLRLDAMFLRLQFAEMNEASDLAAELRQITIFIDRKKGACIHNCIVSRCIKRPEGVHVSIGLCLLI